MHPKSLPLTPYRLIKLTLPAEIKEALAKLEKNFSIFFTGQFVLHLLINKATEFQGKLTVLTDATHEDLTKFFNTFPKAQLIQLEQDPLYPKRSTLRIGQHLIEFLLYDKSLFRDFKKLEEESRARSPTISSFYCSLGGAVYAPYKGSIDHLRNKVVQHGSLASYQKDPLNLAFKILYYAAWLEWRINHDERELIIDAHSQIKAASRKDKKWLEVVYKLKAIFSACKNFIATLELLDDVKILSALFDGFHLTSISDDTKQWAHKFWLTHKNSQDLSDSLYIIAMLIGLAADSGNKSFQMDNVDLIFAKSFLSVLSIEQKNAIKNTILQSFYAEPHTIDEVDKTTSFATHPATPITPSSYVAQSSPPVNAAQSIQHDLMHLQKIQTIDLERQLLEQLQEFDRLQLQQYHEFELMQLQQELYLKSTNSFSPEVTELLNQQKEFFLANQKMQKEIFLKNQQHQKDSFEIIQKNQDNGAKLHLNQSSVPQVNNHTIFHAVNHGKKASLMHGHITTPTFTFRQK